MSKLRLQSRDKKDFLVDPEVAKCSHLIRIMIMDLGLEEREKGNEEVIPLIKVDGWILEKVVNWMEHHEGDDLNWEQNVVGKVEICEWDEAFLNEMDLDTLFEVVLAANYMDIKPLYEVACQKIANLMKGKEERELRAMFLKESEQQKVVMLSDESAPSVIIRSSDGVPFQVETEVAALIPKVNELIKAKVEKGLEGEVFPVPKSFSVILENIIEWVKLHKDDPGPADENIISEVDKEYLEKYLKNPGDLFETLALAQELNLESMVKLITKHISSMITGKTPEDIRKGFNLKDDLTETELKFIRLENKWVQPE